MEEKQISQPAQKGADIPQTITFEFKDIVELLAMVDNSLQPDFPINRGPELLKKIKTICLKYGIKWTGRMADHTQENEVKAVERKHQLEYSRWSAKVTWCETCLHHYYNERNEKHTTIATKDHYHIVDEEAQPREVNK